MLVLYQTELTAHPGHYLADVAVIDNARSVGCQQRDGGPSGPRCRHGDHLSAARGVSIDVPPSDLETLNEYLK